MTRKVYRRFLLAAIMLLITASLNFTSPAQQNRRRRYSGQKSAHGNQANNECYPELGVCHNVIANYTCRYHLQSKHQNVRQAS